MNENGTERVEITLTLDLQEVNGILDVLGDRSFKEVRNLIFKIQNQAQRQIEEREQKDVVDG